jgi:hypothetical protein
MRKLRLDLEEIQVESFRTSEDAVWHGTVRGNQEIGEAGDFEAALTDVVPRTLPPAKSCDTCIITCETKCTCPTYLGCTTCT